MKCKHCGKVYKSKIWLWKHSMRVHDKFADNEHMMANYYMEKEIGLYMSSLKFITMSDLADNCDLKNKKNKGKRVKFFRLKPIKP